MKQFPATVLFQKQPFYAKMTAGCLQYLVLLVKNKLKPKQNKPTQ